ncbi:hypothetical protein [Actinokineospora terrae]|uniref:Excreted virulence factor EspC, type VII ESX diderm n=1 Tax=Actinokineospora terrae TaxID=155974 RepID=A0A1H9S0J4_9PSEU|nr:hypothetical protein [Actinokineospora terrae]SER78464.1 hypothetical protein SAMN04487818_105209 [Actinokineospora terrae]
MTLRLDQQAVTALATEATTLHTALTDIATYAKADPLTPRAFGPLGTHAAEAFAAAHAEILAALHKAAPELDNTVAGLVKAAQHLTETDHDAAARITRAGER